MPRFINRLLPLLFFVAGIAVFVIGIFLLSYLFVFFVAVWLIFYIYNLIRAQFGYPPRTKHSHQRAHRARGHKHGSQSAGHANADQDHHHEHVGPGKHTADEGLNSDGKPGRIIDTEWKKL